VAYLLFDLDGVLVESGPAYRSAWASWAALHGIEETQIWADAHGRRPEEIIRRVAPDLDFTEALVAFDSVLAAETAAGRKAMPGAADCLAALPWSRWAIVTSGRSDHVGACLTQCGFPAPPALVCGDEVSRGKPDPECFLLAADRLKGRPGACIVVEDAPAGIGP
jgi:sugar-phosphatase